MTFLHLSFAKNRPQGPLGTAMEPSIVETRPPTTLEKQLQDAVDVQTAWLEQHPPAEIPSDLRLIGQHEGFRHALVCVLDYFLGNRGSIVCDSDVDAVAAETKIAPPA